MANINNLPTKTMRTPFYVPVLYVFIVLATFGLNVESAYAQTLTCKNQPLQNIKVIVTTNPIKKDNSKSEAQLQRFKIDTINPYGDEAVTEIGGLMSGGLQFKSAMNIAWETDGRQSCYWFDNIEMTLHIDPTIYIANKHRPGSCRYDAILQHEYKHVKADQDVAIYWRPRVEAYLKNKVASLGAVGPYPNAQQNEVRAQMTKFVAEAMKQASEKVNADRFKRQQAIDNRAEYDRVNALCR